MIFNIERCMKNNCLRWFTGFVAAISCVWIWFFLIIMVYGQMALSRVFDLWPFWAKTIAPVLLLLLIACVGVNALLYFFDAVSAKVFAGVFVVFCTVYQIYTFSAIEFDIEVWAIEGVLFFMVNAVVVISYLLAKRKEKVHVQAELVEN